MKIRRVIVKVYQSEIENQKVEKVGNTTTTTTNVKEAIYQFLYPETRLDFTVMQTDKENPDGCFVKIYGVSRDTYSLFDNVRTKKYTNVQKVEIYYGYDDDLSLAFTGSIDRVIYEFANGEQVLTLLLSKNARKFTNASKSISMKEKQTIKSAMSAIAKEYEYDL
ncbi:MAG: hypothetical protein ACRC6E_11550, partial [Fusobacteriaceae bacterium]